MMLYTTAVMNMAVKWHSAVTTSGSLDRFVYIVGLVDQLKILSKSTWTKAIFCIIEEVILCRIIIQVAPLMPAWDKKKQT